MPTDFLTDEDYARIRLAAESRKSNPVPMEPGLEAPMIDPTTLPLDLMGTGIGSLLKAGGAGLATLLGTMLMKGGAQKTGHALESQMGAFRSSADSMLSRDTIDSLKRKRDSGLKAYARNLMTPHEAAGLLKMTDKELAKYGTPEFVLDRYLPTTNPGGNTIPANVSPLSLRQLLNSNEARKIQDYNKELINAPAGTPAIEAYQGTIKSFAPLIEDFSTAQKTGKTLYHDRSLNAGRPSGWGTDSAVDDYRGALNKLEQSLVKHNIPASTIEKKSLQQLVTIVGGKEDEALKLLQKSMEAKKEVIGTRTQELFKSQPEISKTGFVELKTPQDLAHETELMNNCIGAVGRDNGKFIPAFDIITGKPNRNASSADTSFYDYNTRLGTKATRYFSYRGGKPEEAFTVAADKTPTGSLRYKAIEAFGLNNKELTPVQRVRLRELGKKAGFDTSEFN